MCCVKMHVLCESKFATKGLDEVKFYCRERCQCRGKSSTIWKGNKRINAYF